VTTPKERAATEARLEHVRRECERDAVRLLAILAARRERRRAGAHFRATLPPTRGGSPRDSRPAGNPGNPGV
jgi:hypothetical protein